MAQQEQLISYGDFSEYCPLPASLESDERLSTAILHAQRQGLEDLLGPALYRDLVVNSDTANNVALLSGTDYVNNEGNTVMFYGLKPCLIFWSYIEFLQSVNSQPTKSGLKIKTATESIELTDDQYQIELQRLRGKAEMYATWAKLYLEDNTATYPLYASQRFGVHTGFRLTNILQPKYRTTR